MKKRSNGFACAFGIATIMSFSCSDVETTDKPAECELGAVRSCDCPLDTESFQTCIETPTAIVFGDCACFDSDAGLDLSFDLPESDADAPPDITDALDAIEVDADVYLTDQLAEPGPEIVDDADITDVVVPFGTPPNFAAVNNDGTIEFSWTAVDDADGYYIYWALETGVTPDNYATLSGGTQTTSATSPDTLTGLGTGAPIYAVLTAFRGIEQSDPTDEVTVTPFRSLLVVPTFAPHGANWNDYVSAATSDPCIGTETDLDECVHGGENRIAWLADLDECPGVTAADSLNAFEWVCSVTDQVFVHTTGLRDNVNLSDLIDFSTLSWRPITLTVHDTGVPYARSDPEEAWWGNEIVENNTGGTLTTAGQIVVVTSSTEMAPFVFGADKIALIIAPGSTLNAPNDQDVAIGTALFSYLWVEGDVDAGGNHIGLEIESSRFSMFRNLAITNADRPDTVARGIHITNAYANRLHNVEVDSTVGYGVDIESCNNHEISGIRVSNNLAAGANGIGFRVYSSVGIRVSDLAVANSVYDGIRLDEMHRSTFTNISVFNSGDDNPTGSEAALFLNHATNNIFADLLIVGNDTNAVLAYAGCHNNVFVNAAVMNNAGDGFQINGFDDGNPQASEGRNVVANVASFNNGSDGFQIEESEGNSIINLASVADGTDHDYHVRLQDATNNAFFGLLKVGGMVDAESRWCRVDPAIGAPGLIDGTCTDDGTENSNTYTGQDSTATFRFDVYLGSAIVDRWESDDSVNTSDLLGTATYSTDLDWFGFARPYRAWGANSGTGLEDDAAQGRCGPSTGCLIWDFNNNVYDTGDSTYPVAYGVLGQPYGDDIVTHTWYTDGSHLCIDSPAGAALVSCQTTFLINAVELFGDSVGNDNFLCESDEDCLYTPNIGVHQGYGNIIALSDIDTGAITGVDLFRYVDNGYEAPE